MRIWMGKGFDPHYRAYNPFLMLASTNLSYNLHLRNSKNCVNLVQVIFSYTCRQRVSSSCHVGIHEFVFHTEGVSAVLYLLLICKCTKLSLWLDLGIVIWCLEFITYVLYFLLNIGGELYIMITSIPLCIDFVMQHRLQIYAQCISRNSTLYNHCQVCLKPASWQGHL